MLPLQTPIASRFSLPRWDSLTIIVAIMVLAGLAWADMYLRAQSMGTSSMTGMDSILVAGSHGAFWGDGAVFLPMWSVMMAAMMLLSTMPMVIAFSTINRSRRGSGEAYVPTWIFVAGYAVVWVLSGVPGYLAKVGLTTLADQLSSVQSAAGLLGGIVLVGAGLYQLSPLKTRCLSKCRTPMSFVIHNWRDGYRGALLMGVHHGLYCLGCCWALMVVMFPVGIMNLAWMAGLALLILVEKVAPLGRRVARVSGLGLVLAGVSLATGLL